MVDNDIEYEGIFLWLLDRETEILYEWLWEE